MTSQLANEISPSGIDELERTGSLLIEGVEYVVSIISEIIFEPVFIVLSSILLIGLGVRKFNSRWKMKLGGKFGPRLVRRTQQAKHSEGLVLTEEDSPHKPGTISHGLWVVENVPSATQDMSDATQSLERHDAVLFDWERYRTDVDLILDNTAIADGQAHDFMVNFVDALELARDLRPDDPRSMTPDKADEYATAVASLRQAWGRAKSESKKHNLVRLSADDRKIIGEARGFLQAFERASTPHERSNAGRALHKLLAGRFGDEIIAPGLTEIEQRAAAQIES